MLLRILLALGVFIIAAIACMIIGGLLTLLGLAALGNFFQEYCVLVAVLCALLYFVFGLPNKR